MTKKAIPEAVLRRQQLDHELENLIGEVQRMGARLAEIEVAERETVRTAQQAAVIAGRQGESAVAQIEVGPLAAERAALHEQIKAVQRAIDVDLPGEIERLHVSRFDEFAGYSADASDAADAALTAALEAIGAARDAWSEAEQRWGIAVVDLPAPASPREGQEISGRMGYLMRSVPAFPLAPALEALDREYDGNVPSARPPGYVGTSSKVRQFLGGLRQKTGVYRRVDGDTRTISQPGDLVRPDEFGFALYRPVDASDDIAG